jgi:hypothetical protein
MAVVQRAMRTELRLLDGAVVMLAGAVYEDWAKKQDNG